MSYGISIIGATNITIIEWRSMEGRIAFPIAHVRNIPMDRFLCEDYKEPADIDIDLQLAYGYARSRIDAATYTRMVNNRAAVFFISSALHLGWKETAFARVITDAGLDVDYTVCCPRTVVPFTFAQSETAPPPM